MTRPQRQLGFIAAALLASLGIYGLWWTNAAGAAKAELERWIEDKRASGFDIGYDAIETAGFPLRIDLKVTNPRLARTGALPFAWQGPPTLIAHINPLAPNRLELNAQGRHSFERDSKQIVLTFDAADMAIDASGQQLQGLHLDIRNAQAEGLSQAPITLASLSLDFQRRFDLPPVDLQNPSASLAFSFDRLALPAELKPPLSPEIAKLSARLHLRGPAPDSSKAEALAGWSDAGGVLDLESLYLDWPPLVLEGDGTLALDRQLMPIAPFGLKARGVFEAVDALADRGLIEASDALPAKLALAVLAKQPPDPATGLMRLPLTLQGRDLFIGSARLARLPNPPWVEE